VVGRGQVCPEGTLPVFSVDTEEEADRLIVMVCNRDQEGRMYARELAREQTLTNLALFSDRLQQAHDFMKKMGRCNCSRKRPKRV
jgi:hypothetical protein